ncbi:unnamed protein product, partial [Ectocarpus sp. 12 AP-2014]
MLGLSPSSTHPPFSRPCILVSNLPVGYRTMDERMDRCAVGASTGVGRFFVCVVLSTHAIKRLCIELESTSELASWVRRGGAGASGENGRPRSCGCIDRWLKNVRVEIIFGW